MTNETKTPMDVEFKIFSPVLANFGLPKYESSEAAAMDIRAIMVDEKVSIEPGQSYKFRAGFGFHINNPWIAALVLPRSGAGTRGLNLKNTTGLIDSDYQGELQITAINTNPPGTPPIVVEQGERICQLVFVPVVRVSPQWVDEFSSETARGTGGFGSTGK